MIFYEVKKNIVLACLFLLFCTVKTFAQFSYEAFLLGSKVNFSRTFHKATPQDGKDISLGTVNFNRPAVGVGFNANYCLFGSRISFSAGLQIDMKQGKHVWETWGIHSEKAKYIGVEPTPDTVHLERFNLYSIALPLAINLEIKHWLKLKTGFLYSIYLNEFELFKYNMADYNQFNFNHHIFSWIIGGDFVFLKHFKLGINYIHDFNVLVSFDSPEVWRGKSEFKFRSMQFSLGYIF